MTQIYSQPHLPQKFAQDLLDCQIQFQLNQKLPSQMLMKLLELYRVGIEYYESIRSYKYLYFQRKMNSIVKSQRILNNLNDQKPEVVVIESLSDFKKQQITINTFPTIEQPSKSKKVHPFKRHLQQKFQSKTIQQIQSQKLKNQRQSQLKRLLQLQHKQKHQQLTNTLNNIESDKVMKNFIAIEDKKMKQMQSMVDKVVQDQELEFRKKLQERRQRVKSNTQKRRMTKSFSDNYQKWGETTKNVNLIQFFNQENNVQNCQLKVSIDSKGKRIIPSTKMFSSFVQDSQNQLNFQDFVFEEVPNSNKK